MAPKSKAGGEPVSPGVKGPSPREAKAGPGRSPLAGAGATMLGKATSPKGAPPAPAGGINGKASGLSIGSGLPPAGNEPKLPTKVGGSTSARSNTSANAKATAGIPKASDTKASVPAPVKPEPAVEPAKANGNGEAAKAKSAPEKVEAAPPSSKAAAVAASGPIEPEDVLKFHSAVRWAKPWAEIEEAAGAIPIKVISAEKDPKNGNTAMHIAAQNGHMQILEKLIKGGGPVNLRNGKGQTPLHMCVEYDFYFVCRLLIDAGADLELANDDGHKAILGIDGGKIGHEAWDNPVTILRAANTKDELDIAFEALEKALATPEIVSKEKLISCGLTKKKAPDTQAVWDHKRFMGLAAKF